MSVVTGDVRDVALTCSDGSVVGPASANNWPAASFIPHTCADGFSSISFAKNPIPPGDVIHVTQMTLQCGGVTVGGPYGVDVADANGVQVGSRSQSGLSVQRQEQQQ